MAALRLRLRGPEGKQHTVSSLLPTSTLSELQKEAEGAFGFAGSVEVLLGVPPALCTAPSTTPLSELMRSGETVVVRGPLPQAIATPAAAEVAAPTSAAVAAPRGAPSAPPPAASTELWPCPQCTFLNEPAQRKCGVCEFARTDAPGAAMVAQLVKMPDDNSCLFHGISHLLDPSSSAAQLRQVIAKEVQSNSRWDEATLGKPRTEYIDFITSPIRWGGQVELAIFASAYKAEIAVVEVQGGRCDIYGEGSGYSKRVYMLHSGIHFDAVAFGSRRDVPTSDFASADAAAKTLASDQKASGAFVDQKTMRLRCKICGFIAEGDYEARAHAGEMGHKEFAPA